MRPTNCSAAVSPAQYRRVACVDAATGRAVQPQNCDGSEWLAESRECAAADAAAASDAACATAADSPLFVVGAWAPCPLACVASPSATTPSVTWRNVSCVAVQGANGVVGLTLRPDTDCTGAGLAPPVSTAECNAQPCGGEAVAYVAPLVPMPFAAPQLQVDLVGRSCGVLVRRTCGGGVQRV